MVYLDHWALRKFSGDDGLASRLTKALHDRDGTLALSWLNLGEYARVSDPDQRRAAEQFEGILPAVFCIDVDLAAVNQREGVRDPLPHADRNLALLFVNAGKQGLKAFTALGLFDQLNNDSVARTKDRLAAVIQRRLESLRRTHSEDEVFRKAVLHASHPEAIRATTRTRAIVRTLAATFFPDLKRIITPNDAIDFLHAAIPVTYCDVVLLDGSTADLVERARRKLDTTEIRMATVFPGRGDGLERFLVLLEKTQTSST